ncbi:MAG: cation-translocating P-type ATPase [Candidatus Diapherotrites archaeon]|nr:cation-translocating P-type ATPase [Candidatus Diapherotrites archaeon]
MGKLRNQKILTESDIKYWALGAKEVIKILNSSDKGLSNKEAAQRLEKYGPNEIKKEKEVTPLEVFLNQFKNTFIILLIFAGILSLIIGETLEGAAIFFIIILNATLGFIQEYKAEKAIESLKKMTSPNAIVLRDGIEQKIPSAEIVPGDIVILEAGSIVPADCRIIESFNLAVDEASLTGESVPSKKDVKVVSEKTSVADRKNMAYMGTIVSVGKGKAIVTSTGMNTELGKIAESLKESEQTETPLQRKFTMLSKQIAKIVLLLVSFVFLVSFYRNFPLFEIILFCLTITVSTIPNSLPIIVTVGLSLGAKRLAEKNMLVKKLFAAESLGSVTVICSDKTGTLTKNQMTVTNIFFNYEVEVSGSGYEPTGDFKKDGEKIEPSKLEKLMKIATLCNNASLVEEKGEFKIIGDPTEGSLIVMAKKAGYDKDYFLKEEELLAELPFDSERKMMSVIYKNKQTKKIEAYVKGAPDILIKKCNRILLEDGKIRRIREDDIKLIIEKNRKYAESALRVLGFAYKEVSDKTKMEIDEIEEELIFVGLAGMIDPPREEVKEAVKKCEEAGIKVIIITGDHPATAKAVAEKINLFKKGDIVLNGAELDEMNEEELLKNIENIRVIARALPTHKLKIVEALQKKGHIVAMTGDGVNDAPALKRSDIGVAMGITGTDVAKDVSQAILVDDNFATIVNAIEEGRDIYDKIIKSARYLLSCNMGEITAVIITVITNLPLPLTPIQILTMNILTDDLPALGLGTEKPEEGIMKRPPRKPQENPITKTIFILIFIYGLIMGIATVWIFQSYLGEGLTKARTMAFTTLVMIQMFAVVSSRTLYPSIKHINLLTNKWLFLAIVASIIIQLGIIYFLPLQTIYETTSIGIEDWIKIIEISITGFILMELGKFVIRDIDKKNNNIKNI